jgi:AcrR family transcriptional regulator
MSPRGKFQNEQLRAATLEKIQNASFTVFAAYGYNGTTMKQIAVEAGLSYGLVYHYFVSKEAVFQKLVDIACEKSIETIQEGLNIDGTAWKKLENLSSIFVKRALTSESSKYFLIMIQALTEGKSIPGLLEYIEKHSQLHYMHVLPVIVQAQQEGKAFACDPVVLTAAYFSFIQGLAFLVFSGSGIEKQITPEILINVLRKGGENK